MPHYYWERGRVQLTHGSPRYDDTLEATKQRHLAMPALSPNVGNQLLKATRSRDLDEAFQKVFSEYLTLKIADLQGVINRLEKKWGMDFATFKRRLEEGDLPESTYAYDTEQDFWQWEEAHTLKKHYDSVQQEWR